MTQYLTLLERQLDEKGFGTLTKALGTWARDYQKRNPDPAAEPSPEEPAPSPAPETAPASKKVGGTPFKPVDGSIRQKLLSTDWENKPDLAWAKLGRDQKVRILRSTLAKTKAKKPVSS